MASVTTTGFGVAAIEALSRILEERRTDDPLAPAVVLCPSPMIAVGVRRALGRRPGGVAGVSFTTLESLAQELSSQAMAATGRHVATAIEVQAMIRAELTARPGLFGRVAHHRTTEERLVALHDQLAGIGDETLGRLERAGQGLASDAMRVLRGAGRRAGNGWSHDQLLTATLDELAALEVGSRGPIVVFLPEPSRPFEGLLLSAVAKRPDCHLIVGLTGDRVIDGRHVGRLAGWSIQVDSDPLVTITEAMRLEVSDPEDEVRTALRDVVAHAALGVPLSQMAVLYPTADPYATLLAEQLDGAELPWCGPGRRTLATSLTGRLLLRLFAIALNGLERSAVMTAVSSAPILDGDGQPLPVSLWDRLSRQAGVTDGDQWEPRLMALAKDGLDPQELVEANRLLRFVQELERRLSPDPKPASWSQWVSWTHRLLDHYLRSRAEWPADEQQARDQIFAVLDEFRVLDSYDQEADVETFQSIVAAQLEKLRIPGPPLGTGLLVAPIDSVTGLSFERVVLVGLAEGSFPRTPRDDALLPDRVRAESGGLIARNETVTDLDIRAVAAALAGSRQSPLVVTARGDLRSISSRSWPRVLNTLVGRPTIIESHHRALVDHGRPVSIEDFGLRALISHVDGGDPVHTHELAHRDPVLGPNLRRSLNRRRGELNRHVGRVPAGLLDATERLLSATALEAYASCPRSYLLGRVLRLSDDDRPERIDEITPADRGKLIHVVLERFVAESLEMNAVPVPGEPWSPEARELLMAILGDEIGAAQSRGLTGGRVSTRILHRRLTAEMDLFLQTDNAMRADRGSTPVRVELDFGFEDEPSQVILPDGRIVRLRGRVDRVDATDDGGVLVIDYKGGSGRALAGMADDPLDGGRRLQLPLYARVVAEKLGMGGPRTALYWLTRSGDLRPMELEEGLESDLNRTVSAALDGISGGLFPGVPGEAVGWPRLTFANCRYCDFDRICPTDRQREWNKVRHDPALQPVELLLHETDDR